MKDDINFTHNEIKLLKQSREKLRGDFEEAKISIKRLKNRVRYLEKSKSLWKDRAKKLQAEVAQKQAEVAQKQAEVEARNKELEFLKKSVRKQSQVYAFSCTPAYHQYSVGQIMLFTQLVLSATTSFRGASRAMQLVYSSFNLVDRVPSWFTGRLWILRLGYYKLTRSKQISDDWVWIIDHTVQLGREKCLVIVGIRLANLPPVGSCLTHEDLEPIALLPVTKSNGKIVLQQLLETLCKTGVPRQIVADHGSDLKSGIEQFCTTHQQTSFIYDIKHKTAALLRQDLKNDSDWVTFTRFASQTKSQIQQTALAALAPPKQRRKARYMNVDLLIDWGRKILAFFDQQMSTSRQFDAKQVVAKLGWVRQFRSSLDEWQALLKLVTTTESFVRSQGIYHDSQIELSNQLHKLVISERTKQMQTQLVNFVSQEASKCKANERLVGSSEVLESIFGKLKYLEREQACSGFTGLILSLAAMLSSTTHETVKTAVETVSTKQVRLWQKKNLGQSVQAQRREALISPDKTEHKKPLICVSAESYTQNLVSVASTDNQLIQLK